MKRTINLTLVCLLSVFLLSSCYSSQVIVGDIDRHTRVQKVKSKKNHILFYGLIPVGSTSYAEDYVDIDRPFLAKTRMTFVDGLLGTITFSLYTPTTTTYYVPAKTRRRN